MRPRLLVLDEIGYLPCDSRSADLLYNIVSRRHEARSIVITTNLPFRQWGTVFPGAACVAALVDRFVRHRSTRCEMAKGSTKRAMSPLRETSTKSSSGCAAFTLKAVERRGPAVAPRFLVAFR